MSVIFWLIGTALWAQQPVANFTVQPHVCTGQSLVFFNLSQNANSYRWSLGGGATSTAVNPAHIYSTPGVYSIELIAENTVSGLKDTLTLENHVTVHETPNLPLNILGATTVCAGDTVTLVTQRRTGFLYQWYVNDVAIPEATDTVFYAQTTGNYSLRILNPSNPAGACVQTHGPVSVNVFPRPETGNIVVDGGTNLCPGTTVTASVNFDPDASYQWRLNGQVLEGATTHQIVVTVGGSYWVEAFNIGGCRDTSDTVNFVSAPAPNADPVNLSGPTTFCTGDTLVLSTPFLEALTYLWLKDGLPYPNAAVNSAIVTESGEYRLVLENTQGCRDTSDAIVVVVHPPNATGIFASNGFVVCEGDSTRLFFELQENKVFTWFRNGEAWDWNETEFWVYESANYLLALRDVVTGCEDTLEAAVNFVPYPSVPEVFFEGLNPFCYNETLNLLTTPVPGLHYQWYKDDAALDGADNPVIAVNESGFYAVAAINAAGCATLSQPFEALRFPEPELPTLFGPTVGCEGQALFLYFHPFPGQTYLWYRNGEAVASDTFVVVSQNAAYRYAAVDLATGCRIESETFNVVFEPRPPAPVVVFDGPESVCPGQSATSLVIVDFTAQNYQYVWYWNGETLPDSLFADVDGNRLTVRHPGAYFVVAAYPGTGCATASDTLGVGTGIPVANDTLYRDTAWPDSVCAGDSVRLFVNGGDGMICRWYRNGQLLSEGPVYEWYAKISGEYRVEFAAGGCVNLSNPQPVFIRLSDVKLSGFPDTVIFDRTYFNTVYIVPFDSSWECQWYFNGVPIPGAQSSRLTSLQDGLISVRIREPGGCEVFSDGFNFLFNRRNESAVCPTRIRPTESGISISWGCGAKNAVVYDLYGRTVWKGQNPFRETEVFLPTGVYVFSADDATLVKIVRP